MPDNQNSEAANNTAKKDASEVGGSLGEFLGALLGEALAQGDIDAANRIRQVMKGRVEGLATPDLKDLGPTAYGNVQEDPRFAGAENEVLNRLMADSKTGMNAEDRANLQEANLQAQQNEQASRAAVESLARRRGTYNSGLTQASELSNIQGQANRLNQAGVQAAGQASARARGSLNAAGQYAGMLGQRSLNQGNLTAGAADAIARFNQQLPQQRYENDLGKVNSLNGLSQGEIDAHMAEADRKRRIAAGGGRGTGTAIGYAAGGKSTPSSGGM